MPITTDASTRLLDRLRGESTSEVRFDDPSRWLYATDASLYQVEPIGVVLPRTVEDLAAAVRIAAEEGVPVVPRGAATSLSGQTVGDALILDLSKHLNRIGIVDRDRMTVKVQPGVVLDRLNAHLRPLGLMFGPDVSTGDRATLGGMIGNNSAGARSLKYGKTVDHVRSLDVVLDDGTWATFGPVATGDLDATCSTPDRVGRLHATIRGRGRSPSNRDPGAVPQDPPAGERLQPRRAGPRPAGPGPRLGRRPLGVQPGPPDRRFGRDAGGDRRGRGQGRADPPGARAGDPLVRHDPRRARPTGRDHRHRPGGRGDGRPDDARPRRRATPTTPGA